MNMRTTPFWQLDITEQLLKGVVRPIDCVESFIELTPQEKLNKLDNNNTPFSFVLNIPNKYFTIYAPQDIPLEFRDNFTKIVNIIESIEKETGVKFIVSSFFRSLSHHRRVYKAKGIIELSKIPMKSTHLSCEGIDIIPIGKPIKWLHDLLTEEFLERHGLWMEHSKHTPGWAHLQTRPYPRWKSGMSRKYFI